MAGHAPAGRKTQTPREGLAIRHGLGRGGRQVGIDRRRGSNSCAAGPVVWNRPGVEREQIVRI